MLFYIVVDLRHRRRTLPRVVIRGGLRENPNFSDNKWTQGNPFETLNQFGNPSVTVHVRVSIIILD